MDTPSSGPGLERVRTYLAEQRQLAVMPATAGELMKIFVAQPVPDESIAEVRGRHMVSGEWRTIGVTAGEVRVASSGP